MELFAWLIVPLLLLVAVPHELGHLLVARLFGITVLEFGIGLPPRAGTVRLFGIDWTIGWLLPLGAFVRLKGEDGGSEADDFAARPVWQQTAVVVAGPMANLLVAVVAIAASVMLVGRPTGLATVVSEVVPGSPAAMAGVAAGDAVVGWQGQTLLVRGAAGELRVGAGPRSQRAQEAITSGAQLSELGLETRRQMGYAASGVEQPLRELPSALVSSSSGQAPVLGWVGIAQLMQELADVGIPPLAWFLALLAALSLGLGLANLLPVPPLDGSRVVLSIVTSARGRRSFTPKLSKRMNVAGLAALLLMFALVTGADLARLLSGRSLVG